mgnify:CR=1 FL=1
MKSIGSNLIQTASSESLQKQMMPAVFRTKEKVVRRSRIERYLDILRVVAKHGPIKQTHIMYKANLSWIELKHSLEHLMKLKFIKEIDDSSGFLYSISETGISTILNYDNIESTLCCDDTEILLNIQNGNESSKWNF